MSDYHLSKDGNRNLWAQKNPQKISKLLIFQGR